MKWEEVSILFTKILYDGNTTPPFEKYGICLIYSVIQTVDDRGHVLKNGKGEVRVQE